MWLIALVLLLVMGVVNGVIVNYNSTKDCVTQICYFADPTVWEGGLVPSIGDTVIFNNSKPYQGATLCINEPATVDTLLIVGYVMLHVNSTLDVGTLDWSQLNDIYVTEGSIRADTTLHSMHGLPGGLIVFDSGKFMSNSPMDLYWLNVSAGDIYAPSISTPNLFLKNATATANFNASYISLRGYNFIKGNVLAEGTISLYFSGSTVINGSISQNGTAYMYGTGNQIPLLVNGTIFWRGEVSGFTMESEVILAKSLTRELDVDIITPKYENFLVKLDYSEGTIRLVTSYPYYSSSKYTLPWHIYLIIGLAFLVGLANAILSRCGKKKEQDYSKVQNSAAPTKLSVQIGVDMPIGAPSA